MSYAAWAEHILANTQLWLVISQWGPQTRRLFLPELFLVLEGHITSRPPPNVEHQTLPLSPSWKWGGVGSNGSRGLGRQLYVMVQFIKSHKPADCVEQRWVLLPFASFSIFRMFVVVPENQEYWLIPTFVGLFCYINTTLRNTERMI